ncbi:MAG: hypothetical protein QOF83_3417 [Solirubrobacteraceae bacterium]|jgi:hypothetical protein|nr:hypothetical protein [Solirubrobacteraceae bacterium]
MSRASDTLQARAEVLKLARMLGREPSSLAYLETVPLADVRTLRAQITQALWSPDGSGIGKLAAAAKLLPAGLSATISERALGPVISAQLAARLEPSRAVDVAAKLPTPFLADVAIELDPRRTSAVIAGIPPQRIGEITAELVARGEYVTMGQFVGHLDDDALRAALGAMDNAGVLRVGFVLEDKGGLDRLLALMAPGRITGIIGAAAEADLWLEALDLLGHLGPARRRQMIASARSLDDSVLERIVATVVEHELWPEARLIAERDPRLEAKLGLARS